MVNTECKNLSLTAAITGAVTKKGYDTVTVPFVTAAVIQILLTL